MENTPLWFTEHFKAIDHFFSFPSAFLEEEMTENPLSLFQIYFDKYKGRQFTDKQGRKALFYGPTKSDEPDGFGVNYASKDTDGYIYIGVYKDGFF